jgi:hypothetical protein
MKTTEPFDSEPLSMLCGVVPPEYREGVKHQFIALRQQADLVMSFRVPDETEPAPVFTPGR